MYYLGLDLSLTSTGYCFKSIETNCKYETGLIKPKGKMRKAERLEFLQNSLEEVIQGKKIVGCAIEGYAMGIRGGRSFDIGEWGGLARLTMYKHNISTIIVPPSNLKKYISGSGGKDKNLILLKVFQKYGYECASDDEADALGLSEVAKGYFSDHKDLLAYEKDALTKVSLYYQRKLMVRER